MTLRYSSLHARLALVLVLYASAAAGLSAGLFWLSEQLIERAALNQLLSEHLNEEINHGLAQASIGSDRSLQYLRPAAVPLALPPSLSRLAPGNYPQLAVDGSTYHVLVRQIHPGDTSYLLYSNRIDERREQAVGAALIAGMVLIALTSIWLARGLSRRALAPLDQLVLRIKTLNPGQRLPPLPPGSELDVIVVALNDYIAQQTALLERESAFAAAASHELRTPLAVIQGALELIEPTPPQVRAHARLERGLNQAKQMLDTLLSFSRAQAPSPPEPLALHTLIPQLLSTQVLPAGVRCQQQLSPVTLLAPQSVFEIVFLNLLRNALRAASDTGGSVTLHLQSHSLSVRDTGPGIAEADLGKLFLPRFTGQDGGSGMGLYIAKTLAERQGWQLSLANANGGGAEASLRWG